ncbi:hypothetical protein ACVIIV_002321 [Bradyrhizobium sp. USDA 4354]
MAIDPARFATECVHQGLRFGIHPHYLVGAAQLRSGISDADDGNRIGPFRLTQTEWDANCSDEDFDITDFEPEDIKIPELQCIIYALMALRAQNRCLARLGRLPSAVDLYREQWPSSTAALPGDLQAALDNTSALMVPAFAAVPDAPQPPATIAAGDFTPSPPADHTKPVGTKETRTFIAKAPGIMAKLIADFGFKDFQAAAIMGNVGLECDGFREMQEKKPLIPGSRGGFGWAQWTGARRTLFEAFCSKNGLDPFSDEANYGFLRDELMDKIPDDKQSMAVTAVLKTASISKAVRAFEAAFERAKSGVEHFDRRDEWANLALTSFRASSDTIVPPAVTKVLDPDALHRVIARATLGGSTIWAIDQFSDNGGQVLVKLDSSGNAVILASDTTIFPLQPGLVPPSVVAQLSASIDVAAADVSESAPPKVPAIAAGDEVSAHIFAKAKECDDTLVTRNVPGTNNGRVACAFAVNKVVTLATGKPVGGGLSTARMGEVLAKTQRQVSEANIGPGMICISPTHGGNVGHVGIVGEIVEPTNKTLIYSNSSKRGVFSHSFTLGTWKSFYRDRKGLPVFFFAIKQ